MQNKDQNEKKFIQKWVSYEKIWIFQALGFSIIFSFFLIFLAFLKFYYFLKILKDF